MDKYSLIQNILDGKSKQRLRESFFKNNHNDIYNNIVDYITLDIPFKQKIWHWVNDYPNEFLCKTCNIKPTKFNKNWLDGYRLYCSAKCSAQNKDTKQKRKDTNIEKYGVENVAQSNEIKSKIEETNIERYGHKSTFKNEEVREKWRHNIKEKYDVEHPFQLDSVKQKIKETNLEKYGTEYYTQSDEYKDLYKDKEFKLRMSSVYEVAKIKRSKTNLERYGTEHYYNSQTHLNKIPKYMENNKKRYFQQSYNKYSFSFYELLKKEDYLLFFKDIRDDSTFRLCRDTYFNRKANNQELNTNILPLNNNEANNFELSMYNFLDSLDIKYFKNNREILNGKELDIYLPEYNLAIELNGLYWHSEIKISDKNYHLNKSKMCNKKGVELIHIFEDDWLYKQEIVESIIKNRISKIEKRIYDRQCTIKEVKSNVVRKFLDDNHIQGFSKSTYKLGLYYRNELVSLMTFGYRRTNAKKEFELIRFCNKLNTNVVGASSKLFKHFLKNYEIEESYILSYADYSMFNGKMYDMLGFDRIHLTKPNYFWVVNRKREHRFKYNKQKLIKEGYNKDLTEVQIMHSRNYYRIYGCGQIRYEYKL